MICPECGSEYREGFTRCADCDVDLVAEAAYVPRPAVELIEVMETSDAAKIAAFQSLLDEAGIEYATSSRRLTGIFADVRVTGTGTGTGALRFSVRAEDEAEARAIAESLRD